MMAPSTPVHDMLVDLEWEEHGFEVDAPACEQERHGYAVHVCEARARGGWVVRVWRLEVGVGEECVGEDYLAEFGGEGEERGGGLGVYAG